ncbi:MAG: carbohydrate ABC transporter permease [Lachnospiraceae bacterium]|nr:carbohydrate ABC transporter permease [Lachnospiraceae bacterium]
MKKTYPSSDRLKKNVKKVPGYLLVILWTVFIAVLFGWLILASLSSTKDIFSGTLLASGVKWENYYRALIQNKMLRNLGNSCLYTFSSIILIDVVSCPAAYCLARMKFKLNPVIERLFVVGISIPGIMIIMPMFYMFSKLDLTNSRLSIIFLYTVMSVPYTTYYLLTFFRGVSTSYEEAAYIDGAGPYYTFLKIMLPLVKPAVVTVTIFNFISKWNEYFLALIFASKSELRTLGVGLHQMVQSLLVSGDWAGMFTAVVVAFIPTVVIYAILARQIISGVTEGGVKG